MSRIARFGIPIAALLLLAGCAGFRDWWVAGGQDAVAGTLDAAGGVLPYPFNMIAEWAAILFGGSKGMQGAGKLGSALTTSKTLLGGTPA